MNDQTISPSELPPLSDETVTRIEARVFDTIADEEPRLPSSARRGVVRRRWLTGAGIAAAFVVGVMITPPLLSSVSNQADGASGVPQQIDMQVADQSAADSGVAAPESIAGGATSDLSTAVEGTDREIIASGQVTVRVSDIPEASDAIASLAEDSGGYVESTSIGASTMVTDSSIPVVPGDDYGWISIRVPSADLASVVKALGDTGEVLSSSISKQDVTSTAIDLRARVDATRTSVERLTALMAQSGSVSELIEAEVALTDRQAQLESYEQQLTALEDQVAMSSLQVQLTRVAPATTADPAGFGDGLSAGWNGLVVSLNALVIALGFALPWLAVAAVIVLLVWGIRRSVRRSRAKAATEE